MKSLIISDTEKYGPSSPMTSPVNGKGKPEDRKSAPTIELTGPQVVAFGLDKAAMGEKGTATISFVVKSMRAGDEYGSAVPDKNSPKKVTISVTGVTPGKADADAGDDGEPAIEGEVDADPAAELPAADEAGEIPAEEATETPAEETDEEDDEGDEAPATPGGKKKKKKKPAATLERSSSERVSPKEADLPE